MAGCAEPALADRGTHNLVPMVFERLTAHRPPMIFGADYPTPDGTCIRDFVRVADISSAHVAAATALDDGRLGTLVANIGRGEGVSVRFLTRGATGHSRRHTNEVGCRSRVTRPER